VAAAGEAGVMAAAVGADEAGGAGEAAGDGMAAAAGGAAAAGVTEATEATGLGTSYTDKNSNDLANRPDAIESKGNATGKRNGAPSPEKAPPWGGASEAVGCKRRHAERTRAATW
jgi:hypothetical protein